MTFDSNIRLDDFSTHQLAAMAFSPVTPPSGASFAALPGSRSKRSLNHLWPNPVPLECGIIRTQDKQSSTGLAIKQRRFHTTLLRKLLTYIKSKGKSAYPNLRYSHWLNIAKTKLDMTEELAWLYFETFDVVSEISASDRLQFLKMTSKTKELGELRRKLSVDTLQFFLFLFLQNAPRSSLKSAFLTGEEWPSPESDLRQKSSENYHLIFLRANLHELLELLKDSTHLLMEESVMALDFVFSAYRDTTKCSLLSLALSVPSQAGYYKATKSFSLTQFEFWLRSLISTNQYGPQSLLSRRKELRPASCFRSDSSGRVLISSTAPPGLRCALLHRVNRQSLAMTDESLHHCAVYIKNCQRSSIYLLAPLRLVQVEKCSRCVLVLGAVASVVTVNNCDSLTIITVCRSLHISASSMCVLHLLTMTCPLLLPACVHITLAPYNTHYPGQRAHLEVAGLIPDINYWNSPCDLIGQDGDNGESATSETPPTWGLMPPELFRPMEVPYDLQGHTDGILCPIPLQYLQAFAARKETLRKWYEYVDKMKLSKEQSKQLWSNVKDHFEEWLVKEGHKKELVDLGQKSTQFELQLDGWSSRTGQKNSSSKKLM